MTALSLQAVLLMAVAFFVGAALACIIRRSLSPAARPAPAARRVDPLPEVELGEARGSGFGRPAVAPPVAAPAPKPAPQYLPQDLQAIQGIDAATEAKLNDLGIGRYEEIAVWKRTDVEGVGKVLGDKRRIARQNWIEQAQILAKGGQTLFSVRRARGQGSTAAPTPDEGEPGLPPPRPVPTVRADEGPGLPPPPSRPVVPPRPTPVIPAADGEPGLQPPPPVAPPLPLPMSRVGVSAVVIASPPDTPAAAAAAPPMVSDRAAFAREPSAGAPAPAVPIRPAQPAPDDNLQRIDGITAEIEQKLNAMGALRYVHIAQWTPAEVERIDAELGAKGRISRENWIEQAQILSRGGDTRFSLEFDRRPAAPPPRPIKLPDAIREHEAAKAAGVAPAPSRTDLGSLRSVRSKAYQDTSEPGPEAARRAASMRKVVRAGQADDLKRIKGIGVLIEKKLNSLGVSTYEDIANWTSADIDRISQSLDFRGRIERENWVEQARILAAGGDTEFSRRADRETGRK